MPVRRNKKEYVPSTSDIKILDTVSLLNENDEYPLPLGVYKILCGSLEPDFVQYQSLDTFSTLTSFSSKHISNLIMMLLRYGYLEKIFDDKTEELYLKITDKGTVFLLKYHKHKKYKFVKRENNQKPLIVKIEKKSR